MTSSYTTGSSLSTGVTGVVLPSIAAGGGQYSGAITNLGNALLELLNSDTSTTTTSPTTIDPNTGTMTGVTSISGDTCPEASQDYASAYQMPPVSSSQ